MTRSVDRLAEYGLVMRVPAADDGRGVQVRATPSGRSLSKTVAQQRRIVMRNILHDLPRDECEQLALALERDGQGSGGLRLPAGGPPTRPGAHRNDRRRRTSGSAGLGPAQMPFSTRMMAGNPMKITKPQSSRITGSDMRSVAA